jgi:hypothetical protein
MNANRRKQIQDAIKRLEDIASEIDSIKNDEQDYYDNLPENFQNSEKGESSQSATDSLDNAFNAVEESIQELESI